MHFDYHVHTNYSDGRFLWAMVDAAERADLAAVGFADHCNVSERAAPRSAKKRYGFNLDVTHERRRQAIADQQAETSVRLLDGVEMDYDPRDEDAIRSFLADADFDYAIGSVHELDGVNVHSVGHFEALSERERADLVDTYFDKLLALVESGLFDVAAHVDLIERNPALRGFATRDHYERVAAALASADTVPELNAGRVFDDYGRLHPCPDFVSVLREHDVELTLGTDAHAPGELPERVEHLRSHCEQEGIDPVAPVEW